MTLHETKQYLAHKWNAKGRHGTHSPFVYALVEDMLAVSENEDMLMKNILDYFRFSKVGEYTMTPSGESSKVYTLNDNAYVNSTLAKTAGLPFNQLYSLTANPAMDQWFFDAYLPLIQPEDVLAIKPLHKTAQHTQQWQRIKSHPRVKLSIDLFDIGLLFFREEFKEKQHFVLKY